MGILTGSAQDREVPRGVSFGVIGMGDVPRTSFVGLGYLIPNSNTAPYIKLYSKKTQSTNSTVIYFYLLLTAMKKTIVS
jgi:hypothetical protein